MTYVVGSWNEISWPVQARVDYILFPAPHLATDHAAFWLLMKFGVVVGFFTSYPMNWWLIRKGIKEGM